MNAQEFYNENSVVDAVLRDKPCRKDAELVHSIREYIHKPKFNSDKFVVGGFRMF